MTASVAGLVSWSMSRDSEGHRTYKLKQRVITTTKADGPAIVSSAPGVPLPGETWSVGDDVDPWAWCRPDMSVQPAYDGEGCTEWFVESTFSTKPADRQRPNDQPVQDPLAEPPKVSGSSNKYTEEASVDMNGLGIVYSSWEQVRGQQAEFDANRDGITVEQNVPTWDWIAEAYLMRDHVNQFPMWGMQPRCIKLSSVGWQQIWYQQGTYYYKRTLAFDTDTRTFDRLVLDEGTKCLRGHWLTMTGAGLQITITSVGPGGTITGAAVTLGNNGTGYPKSATFYVAVTGGAGTGGVLWVSTDNAGAVNSVADIVAPGSGYVGAGGLATSVTGGALPPGGVQWVFYNPGGSAPSYLTPSHFGLFTDRAGNPTKVTLDGRGRPWLGITGTQPGKILIQKYLPADFLQLGIPIDL